MTGPFIEDRNTEFLVCCYCHRIVAVGALAEDGTPLAADHMRKVEASEKLTFRGRSISKIKCSGSLREGFCKEQNKVRNSHSGSL
jgi:hypothetical protein